MKHLMVVGVSKRCAAARGWLAAVLLGAGLLLPAVAGAAQAAQAADAAQAAQAAQVAQQWVVGPGGVPMALADAVARAADGDTIELLSGEYSGSLLIENRRLMLRGSGKAVVKGAEKLGNARALWTVRGGEVVIENIEFRGARAADGSGAGVRMEGGRLTLRRTQFYDNEHGLLALNDPQAELTIEASVFGAAPQVVGGLYHLLSVGRIGKLSITGSRFQKGFEGHLIKSRAREAFIGYNFIHDGQRGGASYEIELAAGGLATVIGNVIGQGADSQNPVALAYGTEGRTWDHNELRVAHNTFVHYGWLPAWFMRIFSDRLGGDTKVYVVNNLFVGPGFFWAGANADTGGNRYATRGMLRDIDTYGFELPPGSMWRGSGIDPKNIGGRDLTPKGEFEWPVGVKDIKPGAGWSPGAFQR